MYHWFFLAFLFIQLQKLALYYDIKICIKILIVNYETNIDCLSSRLPRLRYTDIQESLEYLLVINIDYGRTYTLQKYCTQFNSISSDISWGKIIGIQDRYGSDPKEIGYCWRRSMWSLQFTVIHFFLSSKIS